MTSEGPLREVKVVRLESGFATAQSDHVIVELPLTLVVSGVEHATLFCTPTHLDELVLGFLWAEGLVDSTGESRPVRLPDVQIDLEAGIARVDLPAGPRLSPLKRLVLTGCCGGITGSSMTTGSFHGAKGTVKWQTIASASAELLRANPVFRETGAAHAAGLWCNDQFVVTREDVGRHNAVDKIGGNILKTSRDTSNSLLVVTGRVSSDLVVKCARLGIAVLVSRGAPTDFAVRLAQQTDLTLVGFSRADRMNVYAGLERIIQD